jgi:hypothetical protein
MVPIVANTALVSGDEIKSMTDAERRREAAVKSSMAIMSKVSEMSVKASATRDRASDRNAEPVAAAEYT